MAQAEFEIVECWPIDPGCCEDWDGASPEIRERSGLLAVRTLRALTGGTVGNCPVLLRPCSPVCTQSAPGWFNSGTTFRPYLDSNGQWLNSCGCQTPCSCSTISEIILPGHAGEVVEIVIDGDVLPTTAYRVDNGNRLVRQDGGTWPACQEMGLPAGAPGTFTIEYVPGSLAGPDAAYAAGVLACEFAKACGGGRCRLPAGVTQITRQGISMSIPSGAFPDGLTGIREVDTFIALHNPYGLKMPSAVWSPELSPGRITTWSAP